MPYLHAPEARHRGVATYEAQPLGRNRQPVGPLIYVGVVYDGSRIPGARLSQEMWAEYQNTVNGAANLTLDRQWDPWEFVARLCARYPGDVLPNPGLDLPTRLQYPRWIPEPRS